MLQVDRLYAGEVGYLAASIKAVADAKVGDTITLKKNGSKEALAGYREVVPMVFCGLFPTDADQFGDLREALGRLQLNDAALSYEPEVGISLACLPDESHLNPVSWCSAMLGRYMRSGSLCRVICTPAASYSRVVISGAAFHSFRLQEMAKLKGAQ